MASYDRSAQRNDKKGKKGKKGGGQPQPARKRKHYSDLIPFRKIVRMLESSGAEYVAKEACRRRDDPKASDNGQMIRHLEEMSLTGIEGKFGERVQQLAYKAYNLVK